MTLARKTIILFLSFIFALTAIFLIISNTVWRQGYIELEHREVMNETNRAQLALNNEYNRLHTLVQDWGPWDETYQFAQDGNDSFVRKNLSEAAMSNLKISDVMITSPNGQPMFELAFDLTTNKYAKPPAGLSTEIVRLAASAVDADTGITGMILLTDGTPMIVTSHPILTSNFTGPMRGTLWFARLADDDYLSNLSDLTQSDLSWSTAGAPVWEETNELVVSRRNVSLLNRADPLLLGVTVPRAIIHFGQTQRNEFLLLIIGVSLLFLFLALKALDRFVLRRMRKVAHFFKELAEHPQLTRRLHLDEHHDELNQIAFSVNLLLSRLEQMQNRIRSLFKSARSELYQRKQAEKELQHLSHHDALTGLFNRLHFETEAIRFVEQKRSLGLVVCDIDGLKLVNDSFGHAAGDELLRNAATLLQQVFGSHGVICRIGGDEFAVLWQEATLPQLENAARLIRHLLINQQGIVSGNALNLDMSVGYCQLDGKDLTTESFYHLFTKADDAMYRQKLSHEQSSRSALVQSMMSLLEARDYITEGHSQRLQELCARLGAVAGLSTIRLNDLKLLAQFHDIGKIGIPDQILFKPGPLTDDEWRQMRRHPEIGHRIARHIPDLSAIATLILHHHERWDGKGYPLGLSGEDIPLESRVLAIIDAYDAMTNNRPYREALTQEQALAEIKKNRGLMFDPQLTDQFLKLVEPTKKSLSP